MALGSRASFRNATGIVAAGFLAASALGAFGSARAETVVAANPPVSSSIKEVPHGECAAFGKYLVEEATLYKKKDKNSISSTFLQSASRFLRSGCKSFDNDGPIQIVTETRQDALSFGVARTLMGSFDIMGVSGVAHCHRPAGGACPSPTGPSAAVAPPAPGTGS